MSAATGRACRFPGRSRPGQSRSGRSSAPGNVHAERLAPPQRRIHPNHPKVSRKPRHQLVSRLPLVPPSVMHLGQYAYFGQKGAFHLGADQPNEREVGLRSCLYKQSALHSQPLPSLTLRSTSRTQIPPKGHPQEWNCTICGIPRDFPLRVPVWADISLSIRLAYEARASRSLDLGLLSLITIGESYLCVKELLALFCVPALF